MGFNPLKANLDTIGITDIHFENVCGVTDAFCHELKGFPSSTGQNDLVTVRGQSFSNCQTYPTSSTCNDCDFLTGIK